MVVVRGEGSFADAVRRALEYAQSRGIDLSGVEVEVVPDPSITDAGAYTEHLGGLRFRVRYSPRYAGDRVLAAHEAGHVAYWTWQYKKRGGVQYDPDVDEPLAEAFGAVLARQLFGVPVTFKGAPMNLTKVLPERFTYITTTVDGKTIAVKVPEWGDYMSRYRAGILVSPYFYNVTNWAHVFGNFTAMPGDVIKTVHEAWKSGAVEVVPGWGAVWRTTPTWTWSPNADTSKQQTPGDDTTTKTNTTTTTQTNTQKSDTINTSKNTSSDVQKTDDSTTSKTPITVNTQKTVAFTDTVNTPQVTNTSTDINQKTTGTASGALPVAVWQQMYKSHLEAQNKAWIEYHRVLAQTGNQKAAMEVYKSIMATAPPPPPLAVSPEIARMFEDRLSEMKKLAEVVNPKNVDEVHEKFIQLRDNILTIARNWPVDINKANEVIGTVGNAISKAFREREEEMRRAEEARKAEEEAMNKRLEALAKAAGLESFWKDERGFKHSITYSLKYDKDTGAFVFTPWEGPKLGKAFVGYFNSDGSIASVKEASSWDEAVKEYERLIKALRDKTNPPRLEPIQGSSHDVIRSAANAIDTLRAFGDYFTTNFFRTSLGTPFMTLITSPNEFAQTAGEVIRGAAGFLTNVGQTVGDVARNTVGSLADAVQFLTNSVKTGAGVTLTILGGGKPSPAKETGGSEFVQPPSRQQKTTDEFVVRPSRAPDYVLAEEAIRRSASAGAYNTALDAVVQSSSGYRPADYVVSQQSQSNSSSSVGYRPADYLLSQQTNSGGSPQMAEAPQAAQESESKRYRGRPVAVAI